MRSPFGLCQRAPRSWLAPRTLRDTLVFIVSLDVDDRMKILIADDHDLLRDTLGMYLQTAGDMTVEGVPNLAAAEALVDAGGAFDLVILDWSMPGMTGLDSLKSMMERAGGQRVALMSGNVTREVTDEALAIGAAGFLPKTLPAKSMINAVRFMAMGEQYAPIDYMTAPAAETPKNALGEKLTQREREVLKGLTQGKSNKEIARDLDLSEPTIKLHVKTLYRKIDASNRTQAAIIAREAGLF